MTPLEYAVCLYEASQQNVGVECSGVEWSGLDTPLTVTITRAPAVLKMTKIHFLLAFWSYVYKYYLLNKKYNTSNVCIRTNMSV